MKKSILITVLSILIVAGLAAGGYYFLKIKIKINNPVASFVSSGPKSNSPWPMFHGNYNHTGYADVTGPATNNLKWKYQIGSVNGLGPNSVIVAQDGTIFVGGNNKITALNPNGLLKWTQNYPSTQGPALSADGKTLYFDSDKSIIAVASQDGTQIWQFPTGNSVLFGPTIGPDGTIYQGSWDKYFYAVTPEGKLKWKYLTKGTISYPSSIDADGNIYLGGGDAHFGPDGNIYAFSLAGKLLWTYDTKMLRVGSPAVGYDGLIYFPGSPDLFVLNTAGKLIWKKGPEVTLTQNESQGELRSQSPTGIQPQLPNSLPNSAPNNLSSAPCPPPPAPCGNAIGSGSLGSAPSGAQGGPAGMILKAGEEVIAGIITPALTPDNVIYIGNPQGKFMAIDAKTQEIKWSYQTDKNPDPKGIDYGLPSFVVADRDGTTYLGAFDHKFYAIDKNGKVKWYFETGDKITEASPAIGADGTIYFTSEDGYLYAIGE